ncbi:D-cysteine desulfhydrase family protein [Diaphorobacter aerolatus]|uniref:D-cysteine desulfhydrase family protein n=1 Tax=Diaphorobacter aerolatus TaxID=1288495 RepID=A0A7H0GKN7_9BURK|nr:D-cysteine desulfhydrase family protein [Diaphorobacter aerolatus]QNP48853.1 D-cysteine desulfhydrase family protein [Diaphorobacter aerolatus]
MQGLFSFAQGSRKITLPRVRLALTPTPLEPLETTSDRLGFFLSAKRDDLTGLALGGNKIRQLEYYFGAAREQGATTMLVTGAIQSNYTRAVAAACARLGMRCHVQLENRVPGMSSDAYRDSGNVLLTRLYGAEVTYFAGADDEVAADKAIHAVANRLRNAGEVPYHISLKADSAPLGSVGYLHAAQELLEQQPDTTHVVLASGSGQTQAGLLTGLRMLGSGARVFGVSVRRAPGAQRARVLSYCHTLSAMLGVEPVVQESDVQVFEGNLNTGYGLPEDGLMDFLLGAMRREGLLLDPVYTGKAFAAIPRLKEQGYFSPQARVVFLHTGGLPALFAYGPEFLSRLNRIDA